MITAAEKESKLRQRFFARVEPELNTGCWLWSASAVAGGYGSVKRLLGQWLAHRASWVLHRGPIPADMNVLHRCDTPACVNPAHLFLGTPKDNSDDKIAKGRAGSSTGAANGNARLTAQQVAEIRARYEAGGISQQKLAEQYGVTQSMISKIVLRQFWREAA